MNRATKSEKSNPRSRRATGPRTAAGKRRSRMNAIKHGIFSKHLLLEGEDPSEYESLRQGLMNVWRPVGVGETLEVEHLVSLYWRRRRCLVAETALIARSPGFVGTAGRADLPNQHLLRASLNDGSAPVSAKITLLQSSLGGLHELKKQVATPGYDQFKVLETLHTIDERLVDVPFSVLYQKIEAILLNRGAHETRDLKSADTTEFDNEITSLIIAQAERLLQLVTDERAKDVMWTSLASLIPSENDLNRIVRSESHTSREIDRSIDRLERMQRARQSRSSATGVDLEL